MHVVIAPDKFKGSLSAPRGRGSDPRGVTRACPAQRSIGYRWPTAAKGRSRPGRSDRRLVARGRGHRPARRSIQPRSASWATAIRPSSRWPRPRDSCSSRPTSATPYSDHPRHRRAAPGGDRRGRPRVIVGIGGSATNDGGAGLGPGPRISTTDAGEASSNRAAAHSTGSRPSTPPAAAQSSTASKSPSPAT